MRGRTVVACLAPLAALGACEAFGPRSCPTIAYPAFEISVVDSVTGLPAAEGAAGRIWRDGTVVDSLRTMPVHPDSLPRLMSSWVGTGTFTVTISKPGYHDWVATNVRVRRSGGECPGIRTVELEARLAPQ